MRYVLLAVLLLSLAACSPVLMGTADIYDREGNMIGVATLVETKDGVRIIFDAEDLPTGEHAFHIHGTGKCEGDFSSADAHFNPFNKQHGLNNSEGPHAGDLENIVVNAAGRVHAEQLAPLVTLEEGKNSLFKRGGTALIVHEGADDYVSDPAGNAGARIACGVIKKRQ